MLTGHLNEVRDRCAERRRHLAQRGDGGIRLATLDLDEHALADAGERGEAIERQPLVATAVADAARHDLEQLAFFHTTINTTY